jgi:hypothetical protein
MADNQPDSKLRVTSPVFNIIREKIFIFLAILFIISVAGLIILASCFDLGDKTFERTISDTLLKIISGTVIGTAVTLLVSDYSQRQLKRKNQDQFKKNVLLRLQTLYAKTKNARRMLRAKGFTTQWYGKEDDSCLVKQSVYDLYMNDINGSQLELEAIRKEIDAGESIFSDMGLIVANLKVMDNYLGNLISEYEKNLPAFEGEPAVLKIKSLPILKKFISSANIPDGFKGNFSRRCKEITVNIRNEINFIFPAKKIEDKEFDDATEE